MPGQQRSRTLAGWQQNAPLATWHAKGSLSGRSQTLVPSVASWSATMAGQTPSSVVWTACGTRRATGAGTRPTQARARTASPRHCPVPRWPPSAATGTPTRSPRSRGAFSTSPPGTARRVRRGATHRHPTGTEGSPLRGVASHREHIQGLVELRLGQVACLDVTTGDDNVADRPSFEQGLFDDRGCAFVAQVAVERGHDRRRALSQVQAPLFVRSDAVYASVCQEAGSPSQEHQRLQQVSPDNRQHDVELEVAASTRRGDGRVVADHLCAHHEHGFRDHGVDLAWHDACLLYTSD